MTGNNLKVNWGDGTVESSPNIPEFHTYQATNKRYTIHIEGDFESIRLLYGYYGNISYDYMDLSLLTNLGGVDIGWSTPGKIIDLSKATDLHVIYLPHCHGIESIIPPMSPALYQISFDGTMLSTNAISSFIDKLYNNTVVNKVYGGRFSARINNEPNLNGIIGPPNSQAMDKLRKMRDIYSWEIFPNTF
jgi:hypothetical protein